MCETDTIVNDTIMLSVCCLGMFLLLVIPWT